MKIKKLLFSSLITAGLCMGALNTAMADDPAVASEYRAIKKVTEEPDTISTEVYTRITLKRKQDDPMTCTISGNDYPCCPQGYWIKKDDTGADANYTFINDAIDYLKRGNTPVKIWGDYAAANTKTFDDNNADTLNQVCHLQLIRFGEAP